MAPSLGKYLNKTILVCIPVLSADEKCRPYKLTGIELFGLWLEGADLTSRFLADEYKPSTQVTWDVFIPFSHIACIAIATASAATPPDQPASADQSQVPHEPAPPAGVGGPSSTKGAVTRKKPNVKGG